jgi:hypothetical protein
MLRMVAVLLGIFFIFAGILGFIPSVMQDGNLFGIFHLNTMHNLVHILTGLLALWVGFTDDQASKIFFQVFGILYGAIAILGFIYGSENILGLIASNVADTWLHLTIAVICFALGFCFSGD